MSSIMRLRAACHTRSDGRKRSVHHEGREVVDQVTRAHDTGGPAVLVHDRQVTQVVHRHQVEGMREKVVRLDRLRIWRHQVAEDDAARIDLVGGHTRQNVPLGEDPGEPPVRVGDQQAADTLVAQDADRRVNGRRLGDGDRFAAGSSFSTVSLYRLCSIRVSALRGRRPPRESDWSGTARTRPPPGQVRVVAARAADAIQGLGRNRPRLGSVDTARSGPALGRRGRPAPAPSAAGRRPASGWRGTRPPEWGSRAAPCGSGSRPGSVPQPLRRAREARARRHRRR